jgi:hypothetical protein
MMSIMCAELSAQVHSDAVPVRRPDERLQRAAVLIRADVDLDRSTPVVPPNRLLAEHLAVHTSRRNDAG